MYIGHYSVSYALRRVDKEAPLSHLFLAVQFADVAWSGFVLAGIEKLHVIPDYMKASGLDLYYMPFTHSLEGALFWSLVVALGYLLFWRRGAARAQRWKTALVMGGAVFSHWLLDLVVHGPDLGLMGDAEKVGLGLWNYPMATFLAETVLLLAGLLLYLRSTRATTGVGRYGMVIYSLVLMLICAGDLFVATHLYIPERLFAVGALVSYLVFAGVAAWLDRKRAPVMAATAAA